MQYTDLQQYQQQQQAIKDLQKYHDPEHLWECILAFQGYEFQTVSGLPFTYQLKKGRNGELTKELWIDRRKNSKSLAWSSVMKAFERQRVNRWCHGLRRWGIFVEFPIFMECFYSSV